MNLINNILMFGSCFGSTSSTTTDASSSSGGTQWWLIVIYVVIFAAIIYFLMIRPQRKAKKQQENTMNSIEPGDSVLTTSGFYGTVVALNGDTIIVEFGNNKNCRIPMNKQAISQIEKANAGTQAQAATNAAPTTNNRKFFGRGKKAAGEEAQAQAEAAQAQAEAAQIEQTADNAEQAAEAPSKDETPAE